MHSALAAAILALHLLFILWVVFGTPVTRRRPVLRWLHLGSLIWGMLIEILPWNCPPTWAENWLEAGTGVAPYQGGFLHYLDALVYPNVPPGLLTGFGVAVCVVNLGIYAVRFPPAAARWLVERLEERRRRCHSWLSRKIAAAQRLSPSLGRHHEQQHGFALGAISHSPHQVGNTLS